MFEQTFKNIDDILHKDAGCSSELDYVEQTSWVLFLKYLDDLEKDKATAALLAGKTYNTIIASEYQWSVWAAPKLENGKIVEPSASIDTAAILASCMETWKDYSSLKVYDRQLLDDSTGQFSIMDSVQYKALLGYRVKGHRNGITHVQTVTQSVPKD